MLRSKNHTRYGRGSTGSMNLSTAQANSGANPVANTWHLVRTQTMTFSDPNTRAFFSPWRFQTDFGCNGTTRGRLDPNTGQFEAGRLKIEVGIKVVGLDNDVRLIGSATYTNSTLNLETISVCTLGSGWSNVTLELPKDTYRPASGAQIQVEWYMRWTRESGNATETIATQLCLDESLTTYGTGRRIYRG